jgi:capsular polysaccharide biosynthesis protein
MNLLNYNQEQEIDLRQLFGLLLSNIKTIIMVTVLSGLIAFMISNYIITPEYSSTVKLYVNNKTASNSETLTTSDISAAQQLVGTYVAIIQSDSMLKEVIREAGVDYTPSQIRDMMSASSVNNTEVFYVTIQGENPLEVAEIADEIAMISPTKIAEIVEGSSVRILDRAKVNNNPVYPNVKMNTAIGLLLGFMLICLLVIVIDLLDTKINTEEDIEEITDLPILGVISEY